MADDEPIEDIVAAPPSPKITRKRVSGADILAAIEDIPHKIASAIPGGSVDESSDGSETDDDSSSLPPTMTFVPEEDPTPPTPLATDAEATAPIPPVVSPGRRKGFPHRGRRGRG